MQGLGHRAGLPSISPNYFGFRVMTSQRQASMTVWLSHANLPSIYISAKLSHPTHHPPQHPTVLPTMPTLTRSPQRCTYRWYRRDIDADTVGRSSIDDDSDYDADHAPDRSVMRNGKPAPHHHPPAQLPPTRSKYLQATLSPLQRHNGTPSPT